MQRWPDRPTFRFYGRENVLWECPGEYVQGGMFRFPVLQPPTVNRCRLTGTDRSRCNISGSSSSRIKQRLSAPSPGGTPHHTSPSLGTDCQVRARNQTTWSAASGNRWPGSRQQLQPAALTRFFTTTQRYTQRDHNNIAIRGPTYKRS